MKKSEPKTGISVQDVSGRNKRPSKYKVIEPSKLEDLVKYQPHKYRALPETTLNHLTEGEVVKLVFVNREDIWINVEAVDHEEGSGDPGQTARSSPCWPNRPCQELSADLPAPPATSPISFHCCLLLSFGVGRSQR